MWAMTEQRVMGCVYLPFSILLPLPHAPFVPIRLLHSQLDETKSTNRFGNQFVRAVEGAVEGTEGWARAA